MLNETFNSLVDRGYSVKVFENVDDANAYLNDVIDNTTVGIGGSVTVKEMGLYNKLKNHNTVYWHNDLDQVNKFGVNYLRKMASCANIYISSVNAISKDGVMINLDGAGNRIASTIWGHEKVYLIIGKNKICDDFSSAYNHVKNISAPKNAYRLKLKTPCAIKGDKCYNCKSPDKICRTFMIYEAPSKGVQTEIILVNENLGY